MNLMPKWPNPLLKKWQKEWNRGWHGHPHLAWDAACEIEVHEVMPLPG